jgi:hypothetical protein
MSRMIDCIKRPDDKFAVGGRYARFLIRKSGPKEYLIRPALAALDVPEEHKTATRI